MQRYFGVGMHLLWFSVLVGVTMPRFELVKVLYTREDPVDVSLSMTLVHSMIEISYMDHNIGICENRQSSNKRRNNDIVSRL